uniref:Uncharacterized protein n=1 Tax=Naja naja TaxID=35670 RepID=A0A8C6XV62_NAJNA
QTSSMDWKNGIIVIGFINLGISYVSGLISLTCCSVISYPCSGHITHFIFVSIPQSSESSAIANFLFVFWQGTLQWH